MSPVLVKTAAVLLDAALAPNTKKAYSNAYQNFMKFLLKFYPSVNFTSVTLDMLIIYVSFLFNEGRNPNTITSYLAALSYYFKLHGLPDLPSHFLIQRMLRGARRLSAVPDTRCPITFDILKEILRALTNVSYSFYQRKLFYSMFLLAFHAFLRVGEITNRTSSNPNLLQLSDVEIRHSVHNEEILVLKMSNFKHNVSKQPVWLEIQTQNHQQFCPVVSFKEYLKLRG